MNDKPVAWRRFSATGRWMYRHTNPADATWEPVYLHPPAPSFDFVSKAAIAALASGGPFDCQRFVVELHNRVNQ